MINLFESRAVVSEVLQGSLLMSVKSVLLLSCMISGLLCAGPALAEIYKWVDKNGQVHYSDKKPATGHSDKVQAEVSTYQFVTIGAVKRDVGPKVIMYSTSWCKYCKKARRYFQANHIAYIDYDVEKDLVAKRRYKELGATGVPVILFGNKRMNGFSVSGFERIYRP